MELDEILGVDPTDRHARHARDLVEEDRRLIRELRRIREGQRLTQADLAERMDISQSAVAKIESGERDPRLSTIRRLAMGLGVTVSHVIEDPGVERARRINYWLTDQLEHTLFVEHDSPSDTGFLVKTPGRKART